jgi:hypothetical protein
MLVLPEGAKRKRTGNEGSDPHGAAGPVGRVARRVPAGSPIRELAGRDHIKARRFRHRHRRRSVPSGVSSCLTPAGLRCRLRCSLTGRNDRSLRFSAAPCQCPPVTAKPCPDAGAPATWPSVRPGGHMATFHAWSGPREDLTVLGDVASWPVDGNLAGSGGGGKRRAAASDRRQATGGDKRRACRRTNGPASTLAPWTDGRGHEPER